MPPKSVKRLVPLVKSFHFDAGFSGSVGVVSSVGAGSAGAGSGAISVGAGSLGAGAGVVKRRA